MAYKVKDWNKFQHFKDRKPPWIKLYRDILDDLEWHELDPLAAKALVAIWLIASENDGCLPDTKKLAFRLRLSEKQTISIVSQLSHWLIQDDITMISDRYQDDSLEKEIETEVEKERETKSCRSASSADFDRFWSLYPRREGKGNAAKAWPRAIAKASPEHIIQKLEEWKESKGFPMDAKFVPLPASWLNAERWSDEMEKDESIFGAFGSSGTNKEEEIERIRKEMAELWQNQ